MTETLTVDADVTHLTHLIRSPTWIAPPQTERMLKGAAAEILQSAKMDGHKFTPEQIERFRNNPSYYQAFVKATEEQVNARFRTVSHSVYFLGRLNANFSYRWLTKMGSWPSCRLIWKRI